MAGQIAETFVLLRSCLECAGYGFAMFTDPALTTVWLDRHQDGKTKKASVQEFQIKNIREMIERADARLACVFQELYDRTIDFGAHPNERAATSNMAINQGDDRTLIVQRYLHGDSLQLDLGLKSTAQVGVCCLKRAIVPARPAKCSMGGQSAHGGRCGHPGQHGTADLKARVK